jgi:hypothetical protein
MTNDVLKEQYEEDFYFQWYRFGGKKQWEKVKKARLFHLLRRENWS